jgi:diphthamide biosynthesis protein 2
MAPGEESDGKETEAYDIESVVRLVGQFGFKRIAIQFPDDNLHCCVPVYEMLSSKLGNVEIFITADSTWGSSIDDVSAMHYDADLLVYFGSDLSSSGTMPVVVVPNEKRINITDCCAELNTVLSADMVSNVILFYEPSYHRSIDNIVTTLEQSNPSASFSYARLPPCADLLNWRPDTALCTDRDNSTRIIGGLVVDAESSQKIQDDGRNTVLIYIGEKLEQRVNIFLSLTDYRAICYSPMEGKLESFRGDQTIEFRERYGGVSKVKDANIIGIIIGSMGLTAELTNGIVRRLQLLIEAAGKRHYCFVMGRLTEAKLCNFPEIDLFCLISNDDCTNIKPKTFHVPVITPYELELGLGAREWQSSYTTDIASLLNQGDEEFHETVQRVRSTFTEDESDGDSNSDGDGESDEEEGTGDERENVRVEENVVVTTGAASAASAANEKNRQVVAFESAAGDFLQARDYQGLVPTLPLDKQTNSAAATAIVPGQFGIASSYVYR